MDHVLLLIFTFVVSLGPVCGEYCTAFNRWGSGYRTFYCSFGCCGPSIDEYCCAGSAGTIVGIVMGGICALAFAVTIICCCVKQYNHRGQIIHHAPGTGTFVSSHTTNANIFVVPTGAPPTHTSPYPGQYNVYGAPGHPASFPAPPAYSQPGFPQPPAYNQTGVLQPPNYSQLGVPPPTYSQAGASSPTYYNNNNYSNNYNNNNNYSNNDNNGNNNDMPHKPPVPVSART